MKHCLLHGANAVLDTDIVAVAEWAGIAFHRVALPQRDRSYAGRGSVLIPPDDPDGVAADADILRLVERAAVRPGRAAVLSALRGDFLALEEVYAECHAALADHKPPQKTLPCQPSLPTRLRIRAIVRVSEAVQPALFRAPRRCDGGHGVTR